MSLHPCFRWRWLDINVFLWLRKQQPRFAQASPRVIFKRKNLIEQLKPLIEWMLYEKSQYAEFNVPTCGKIAVWQLCRERQPVWNSHDGLNLTCLDQCHGVCSRGTSSSEVWHKRIVIKSTDAYSLNSKFDRWVYILVFAEGDCCRFA